MKKVKNLNIAEQQVYLMPVVSTSTLDDEKTPYCTDCGNDDLAYIDQYANCEYWKCKECGKEFITCIGDNVECNRSSGIKSRK